MRSERNASGREVVLSDKECLVLDALRVAPEGLSTDEVMESTGVSRSAVSRCFKVLREFKLARAIGNSALVHQAWHERWPDDALAKEKVERIQRVLACQRADTMLRNEKARREKLA